MTSGKIFIPIGLSRSFTINVKPEDTALSVGSGSLEVFATPSMIALMEKASLEAVNEYIPDSYTSVGIRLEVNHFKASKIGSEIRFESCLIKTDDKKLTFEVKASENNEIIGKGTHDRFIVEKEKFMKKLI